MKSIVLPTQYYQQFDADYALEVPAEGYGGWKTADLPLDLDRTAFVCMHAWDCGSREEYLGWQRCVEYIPRSYEVSRNVFPSLFGAVRNSGSRLFHVVAAGSDYYKAYQGYELTQRIAGVGEAAAPAERMESGDVVRKLQAFKSANVFPGDHNKPDIANGRKILNFLPEARPLGDEPIAETSEQLFALCRHFGVDHLIYCGFAINGCLWTSPGGMYDMMRRGLLCSAVSEAVTAIENKETAATEAAKQVALWQVALLYGFVYKADDLIRALPG